MYANYGTPVVPNYGAYSGYGNNYNYGAIPTATQPPMQQPQFKTNKLFVTSLEDALARYAEANSETVYLHQDLPLLYEVKTDAQGKKTFRAFDLMPHVEQQAQGQSMAAYATKVEVKALEDKIEALNKALNEAKINEPIV